MQLRVHYAVACATLTSLCAVPPAVRHGVETMRVPPTARRAILRAAAPRMADDEDGGKLARPSNRCERDPWKPNKPSEDFHTQH